MDQSVTHEKRDFLLKLVKKHVASDGALSHTFVRYDSQGNARKATPEDISLYYASKTATLVLEVLLMVFFTAFGLGAFGTAAWGEAVLGSGWIVNWQGMIAVTVVYAVVGFLLLTLYAYFAYEYCIYGDEQIDELMANLAAIFTMYITTLALLLRYFGLSDVDNDDDDLNFRRLLIVVMTSSGALSTILLVRAMTRHSTVEVTVSIGNQDWACLQAGTPSSNTILHGTVPRPWLSTIYSSVVWLSTAALLSFVVWLLVLGTARSTVPDHFHAIYLTTFITLGAVSVVLTVAWILWTWGSGLVKRCFAAHFDVFYVSHALFIAAIVFMLLGYRYTYSEVPDDYFPDGTTIPSLKLAYWNKISILQFVLLPIFSMAVAKGAMLMSQEYPIDVHRYAKKSEEKFGK